jgi:hypothetical protein
VVVRTLCGKFYRLQATDNKGDICGRRESNGLRQFTLGRHYLTFFGIGYYVFSSVAGLIPITVPAPGDTIGNRQLDRTHTFILVATDNWRLSEQRQLSFSVSFGTMLSPCGRISVTDSFSRAKAETFVGGETTYIQSVRPWLSVLAGVDVRRDAPRNLDLKHLDDQGVFQPVTRNNLTSRSALPSIRCLPFLYKETSRTAL